MRRVRMRSARFVRRALKALVLALIGLAATELALRAGLSEALPIVIEAPIFCKQGENRIGLRPGVDLRSRGAEWDVRLRTNSLGLRDLERAPSGRALRVLGLGDSFTFGWGVPFEAAYLARLEQALGRERGGDEVQVFKAAVPGWGPTDELAWLRDNGAGFAPRVLLLGFMAGNDFYDTAVGGGRQYEIIEGIQVPRIRHRSGLTGLKAFLRRHSALYRAAAAVAPGVGMRWVELRGRPMHWSVNDIFLRRMPEETGRAVAETLATLDAMRAWAGEHGASFVVVVIPSRAQVHAEDFARFKQRFDLDDSALDMQRPQRVLAAWATERGVPLLDLLPELRAEAARDGPRLYFRNDSHWNEAGHALAARLVARFLLERGLVETARQVR